MHELRPVRDSKLETVPAEALEKGRGFATGCGWAGSAQKALDRLVLTELADPIRNDSIRPMQLHVP